MLEVENLTKHYGGVAAINGLSFSLEHGICAVLGPNGAGKTTLLRVVAGAVTASDGTVTLDGVDILADRARARRHVSYLSDSVPLYKDLSVEEHLTYRGRLKGLSGIRLRARLRHVMEAFDLKNIGTARTGSLSAGQRKRVGIADAMLCETRVLLIDEPFAGLDAEHVSSVIEAFSIASKHANILFATHDLSVVSKIDGQAIVLYAGRLAGMLPVQSPELPPLAERYLECVNKANFAEATK